MFLWWINSWSFPSSSLQKRTSTSLIFLLTHRYSWTFPFIPPSSLLFYFPHYQVSSSLSSWSLNCSSPVIWKGFLIFQSLFQLLSHFQILTPSLVAFLFSICQWPCLSYLLLPPMLIQLPAAACKSTETVAIAVNPVHDWSSMTFLFMIRPDLGLIL